MDFSHKTRTSRLKLCDLNTTHGVANGRGVYLLNGLQERDCERNEMGLKLGPD